ncbi:MAG: cupin domain-containing protein [Halobacteriales archaeon]
MAIERLVVRGEDVETERYDWGEIVWLDEAALTGTDALTVGEVTIHAGAANGEHYHPDCDEALYLLAGRLRHTLGDEVTTLAPGDLLHVPQGERHRAESIGDTDARAVIAYDTGHREAVFVE